MSFIHIPVVEISHLLMKLRNNRPFLRIGKIMSLSLVALSAIGCASEWIKAYPPDSIVCIVSRVACYHGPPLTLPQFIFELGASRLLLLLPLICLIAALLFLFSHPRTYLLLLILSFGSFLISIFANAGLHLNYDSGVGASLHFFSTIYLHFLTWPLAFDEQMRLHPDWDYRKYLPSYMY